MGKDNKQVILLIVIILGAIALIDLGNSKLSGRQVDEATMTIIQNPPVVNTYPATKTYCNSITDITQIISGNIPNTLEIRDLVDIQKQNKEMVVVVTDSSSAGVMWHLYDLGIDGIFSKDDKVIISMPLQFSQLRQAITSYDTTGRETLFWSVENNAVVAEIWSCTLPNCADAIRRASISQSEKYRGARIFPYASSKRVVIFLYGIQGQTSNKIVSCSLDPGAGDSCLKAVDSYKIEKNDLTMNTVAGNVLKDLGILLSDMGKNTQDIFSYSLSGSGQIIPLSPHTVRNSMVPYRYNGLTLQYDNWLAPTSLSLVLIDLQTGREVEMDKTPINTGQTPLFISASEYSIASILNEADRQQQLITFSEKKVSQPQRVIGTKDFKSMPMGLDHFISLRNGRVIGVASPYSKTAIWSFDCTP